MKRISLLLALTSLAAFIGKAQAYIGFHSGG
jgi:hypothetical protein